MYVTYQQIVAALVRDGIDPEKPDDQNIYRDFIPTTHVAVDAKDIFPEQIAEQVNMISNLLYKLHGQVAENVISMSNIDYREVLEKKRPWVAVHLQDWIDEGIRQRNLDPKQYELIKGKLFYIDPEEVKKEQEQIDAMRDELSAFCPHATLRVHRIDPEQEKE